MQKQRKRHSNKASERGSFLYNNYMNETLTEFPKEVEHYIGKKIEQGNDFDIFEVDANFVAKRPRITGKNITNSTAKYRTSNEYFEQLQQDHEAIKNILVDNLAETHFYPATQNRSYILLQERFKQNQIVANILETTDRQQFITQHKEQFTKLVFASKKAVTQFGVPLDITPNNLALASDGTIKFIENDTISERANSFFDDKQNKNNENSIYNKVLKDLNQLQALENALNLEQNDVARLNKEFKIDQTEYEQKVEKIKQL